MEVATAQTSGLVNHVFSRQTGLFEHEHLFINKLTVIIEPAIASTWLLGLGSELYPMYNNMSRMLNKDFTQVLLSLPQVH